MVLKLFLVLLLFYLLENVSTGEQSKNTTDKSSFCIHDVDMEEEGVYRGSACFVALHLKWDEALQFCREQDMDLFMVKTKFQFYALLELAEKIYGRDDGTYFWVNAKRDINRNNYWIAYSNNKEYAMVEYYRLLWVNEEAKTAGDCLTLTNIVGPFRATGKHCANLAPFVCSYTKS